VKEHEKIPLKIHLVFLSTDVRGDDFDSVLNTCDALVRIRDKIKV